MFSIKKLEILIIKCEIIKYIQVKLVFLILPLSLGEGWGEGIKN